MLSKDKLTELIAICKSSRPGDGATPEMHEAYQQSVMRAKKIISNASTFTGSAELLSFYKQCLGDPGRHPFLLAAERGHGGIVEFFMKTPPGNALYDSEKDPAIWYATAFCYTIGIGVEKNLEEAIKWNKQLHSALSANINDGNVLFYLGRCCAKGIGGRLDFGGATRWYNRAADLGNANAQANLGYYYLSGLGLGVERDEDEGIKWLQRAAYQEHASAQANLGYCYLNGLGVEKNEGEAVKWLQRAADQEHASAQVNLGYCYLNGLGVEKNENEAVKWLQRAADQGLEGVQKAIVGLKKNQEGASVWSGGVAGLVSKLLGTSDVPSSPLLSAQSNGDSDQLLAGKKKDPPNEPGADKCKEETATSTSVSVLTSPQALRRRIQIQKFPDAGK